MKPGQAVRYKGKPVVFGEVHIDPGSPGTVIGIHQFVEMWIAVKWDGMTRPTFHLEKELEPAQP
jgi:hypothetical protein